MHQQEKAQIFQPRMLVLFVLLALLITSSYLNYHNAQQTSAISQELPVVRIVTDAPSTQPTAAAATNIREENQTFSDYAAQRDQSREEEIKMLDEIIKDSSSSSDLISQAQTQKLEIISGMEKEGTLQSLLKARGFDKALAYVSGASVTVVIDQEELSESQLTQILDLAMRETGEKAENIKIIARK